MPSTTIRNLGSMIDGGLTISSQLSRMCKSVNYHLYAISKIRRCLTPKRVHALMILQLDYGNALLSDIMEALMAKLQMVQHSGVSIINHWYMCSLPCTSLHQDTFILAEP